MLASHISDSAAHRFITPGSALLQRMGPCRVCVKARRRAQSRRCSLAGRSWRQRRPELRGAVGSAQAWFTVPLSFLEICFLFQCGGTFGGLPSHGGLLRRQPVACVQLSSRVALVSWESHENGRSAYDGLGEVSRWRVS